MYWSPLSHRYYASFKCCMLWSTEILHRSFFLRVLSQRLKTISYEIVFFINDGERGCFIGNLAWQICLDEVEWGNTGIYLWKMLAKFINLDIFLSILVSFLISLAINHYFLLSCYVQYCSEEPVLQKKKKEDSSRKKERKCFFFFFLVLVFFSPWCIKW